MSSGSPGLLARKGEEEAGEGEVGRPALPLGSPSLPAETSRLREVRRELPRRGAAGLGPSLSPRPGARRGSPGGEGVTHRHGGDPGRREQKVERWKGLSGRAQGRGNPATAAPLGCRPPLLRPFPSPALPRPLPSAHKTFFFFQTSWEDLGGPMSGGKARTNSGGGGGLANRSAGRARRRGLRRWDGRARAGQASR